MSDRAIEIAGLRAWLLDPEGPPIASERDAAEVVGEMFGAQARWALIPLARLDPGFFDLKTRLAGEILQKFVTYDRGVALVGDISEAVAKSGALRDFVRESNRGRSVWFVRDLAEFEAFAAKPRSP